MEYNVLSDSPRKCEDKYEGICLPIEVEDYITYLELKQEIVSLPSENIIIKLT
jgi:hypothetical protein